MNDGIIPETEIGSFAIGTIELLTFPQLSRDVERSIFQIDCEYNHYK